MNRIKKISARLGISLAIFGSFLSPSNANASEKLDIIDPGQTLNNGEIITINSTVNTNMFFTIDLPEQVNNLSIDTFGGTGDADLYLKSQSMPSENDFDCRSWSHENDENCSLDEATVGIYYIVVSGSYNNVSLSVKWDAITNDTNNVSQNSSINGIRKCKHDRNCVVNYNKNIKLGHISTAAVAIGWKGIPHMGTSRRGLNNLQNWFNRVSREKVSLRGKGGATYIPILPTVNTKLQASCANRAAARRQVKRDNHYRIRIYDYAGRVCGYAGNAAGNARGGSVHINRSASNSALMTHEMGHVFKLGHSWALKTEKKKLTLSSAERSTSMGAWGGISYNAPQLHWLNFVERHEVVKIRPTKQGKEYTLRAIGNNKRSGRTPIALVYDIPTTGNRLFLSIPKLKDKLYRFRGVNLHITSPCKNDCSLLRTLKVAAINENTYYKNGKFHRATYVDDLGLKIEIMEVNNNWDSARIRITKVDRDLACTRPPTIRTTFTLKRKYNINTDRHGLGELIMEITNNNKKGCRPIIFTNPSLIVTAEPGFTIQKRSANKKSSTKGNFIWSYGDKARKRPSTMKRVVNLTSSETEEFNITVKGGNFAPITIPVSFNSFVQPEKSLSPSSTTL